jgi:branched-chain amino acid transport system ATP-binding protein
MPILAADGGADLLSVQGLDAGYGKVGVLHGVTLTIRAGEIVALLGPNGAGKTTLLKALSGLLPLTAGDVLLQGGSLRGLDPRECARRGLVHVVEGHRVFTQISVEDNLALAGYDLPRAERARRVGQALDHFPEIAAKRAERGGALSGGQQQMLAVAQGLVRRPRLLLLDEPSAGLSPVLVDRVLSVLEGLRAEGTAVLLVEQLVEKALAVADRAYALAQGRIVLEAPAAEPGLANRLEHAYLGAGAMA